MKRIFKIEELKNNDNIEFLANEIRHGKVCIIPTSTIYGIIANALDFNAVERVYEIKGRDKSKSLITLVKNKEDIQKFAYISNNLEQRIIDEFFPGSVTLILQNKNVVASNVTSTNTIAIRQDGSELLSEILNIANVAVVAPSANISGNNNIVKIEDLEKQVIDKVDYIIDAGKIESTDESTIVKVENNQIEVLREGKVSKQEILDKVFDKIK